MSLWRDDTRLSRLALGAVFLMGLLAIASLARVFTSPLYLAWALPATAVGVTFAVTYGRRSLALAFGMLAGVVVLTLPSLFARELTTYLIPTADSWRLVHALLRSGLTGIMSEAAPVPVSPRYLIVLWIASLAGGFLAASWVVVGRPIGAMLTALGVIVFSGQVGIGFGRDLVGLGAITLIGAFLLLDGRHRIASWSVPRPSMPPHVGTATLAIACIAGLAAPAVIGSASPWLEVEQTLRPRVVVIKPLSDVRRQLDVEPPVEVMRVTASQPTYWRLTALDDYTGTEWLLEARPRDVQDGRVPAAEPPTTGPMVHQRISITSLLAPWLPAAFAPLQVDTVVPFEADAGSATLLLKDETLPGLQYTVVSQLPDDTAQAPAIAEHAGRPDSEHERFAEHARPVLESFGAATPYEQAVSLQNWFRNSFRYDEDVEGGHDVERLERFLNDRVGYCEQFAAVMTLMLRGLGTPARVAVGFLPGGVDGQGDHVVTTKDAHAWVEALIPGMGWMAFDPTPGRGIPAGEPQDAGQAQEVDIATPPPPPAIEEPTPAPQEAPAPEEPAGRQLPVRAILSVLLVAAVVSSVPGAKAFRRNRRRQGSPHTVVIGAYAELIDGLRDLGVAQRPSETDWELWRRVFGHSRPGWEPSARVIDAAGRAVYGPDGGVSVETAEAAWNDAQTALAQARGAEHWLKRLRAIFDPRTLLPGPDAVERILSAGLPQARRRERTGV